MGLINHIVGAATGPVDALGNAVDKIFTSEEERLNATAALEGVKQRPALTQAEANKTAAQHRNWFVAGGRPALLWVCALGWLVEFLLNPIFQITTGGHLTMPVEQMVWLTSSVLGIYGGLRTVEKLQGRTY